MAVSGNVARVPTGRIVHELAVLGPQALQTPLDDVVAIQVPDQGNYSSSQGVYHKAHLQ